MRKFLHLLSLVLCVSGCMRMDTSFDEKEVGKTQKAFIVTRSKSILPSGLEANLTAEWINGQTRERFTSSGEDFYVYMIDPGYYELSSLDMTKWVVLWSVSYRAAGLSNIAYFGIKGGEVLYIGDIFIDMRRSKRVAKALEIKDSFGEAQAFISKKYPVLSGRLQRALVTLSEPVRAFKSYDATYGGDFESREE